jgi:hypothetical protein
MHGATVRRSVPLAPLLVAGALLIATAAPALGHPLHTTLTEIGRGDGRTLRATIRVFADDFGRAVLGLGAAAAAPAMDAVSDSAASAYVRAHFTIATPDGRALPLSWCGVRRTGDLVWVCLEAAWSGAMDGMRVHDRMLFELYRDQINIVQASDGGSRASLLFTSGDGPKRIS